MTVNPGHPARQRGMLAGDLLRIEEALPYSQAQSIAEQMLQEHDERISDKWGPAGAIRVKGETYRVFEWGSGGSSRAGYREVEYDGWLFFGYASS